MSTKATISQEACKGCGLCVSSCPKKIIELSDKEINSQGYYAARITDADKCIGCAFCAVMCPDLCITVEEV
jgi:2-oxoglutarate ferredoxin oxidoreductase subunit delta